MIVAAPTRMDDQNRCYSTKQIRPSGHGQPLAVRSLFRSLFQGRKWPGSWGEAISSIYCL